MIGGLTDMMVSNNGRMGHKITNTEFVLDHEGSQEVCY